MTFPIEMEVKVLDREVYAELPGKIFPERGPEMDAGFDLRATEGALMRPGESGLMGLGIAVHIPRGFVGLLFPRSGLGSRGLILGNGTGVIDSGYHGELKACLWNRGDKVQVISRGDRVCQFVIVPHAKIYSFKLVDEFTVDSERGENGYGSTGVK